MRVLFVVFPEAGHLLPMIAVAHHLVRGGHAVDMFSMEDLTPKLAAAGLAAHCHTAGIGESGIRRPTRGADLLGLLSKPALAKRWYRHALIAQVPVQLAALREVIRTVRPDVIATDPFAYAGVIAAEEARLPWAAISTQLLAFAPPELACPYFDHLAELAASRDALVAEAGVTARFHRGEAVSPWLSTVFATDALGACGHARCVGPALPPAGRGDERVFPWHRLRDGLPLVYVSFGSQLVPPAPLVEALTSTLAPDAADIVIVADPPAALPAHFIAVTWAPQLALLARARVAVTHGGANSFTEALAHGVPQLVVPLVADQPVQAYLIERAASGIALAPEALTHDAIAAAIHALLADGPLRQRAGELRRSYAAADGARGTAQLLLGLATSA